MSQADALTNRHKFVQKVAKRYILLNYGQILEIKIDKQAGAELNQAQVNLKVIVEVGVEVGGKVEAFHY